MNIRQRALVLSLLACTFSASAGAQSIAGRYEVRGANPGGSPYRGTAEIVVTSANTCRITWNTGSTSSGICMRNQNAFSAAYSMGGKVGLVIYEIKGDGTMEGLWTIADQTGVGSETLVPQR